MIEYKKAGIDDLLKIQKIAYETWPNTFGQRFQDVTQKRDYVKTGF